MAEEMSTPLPPDTTSAVQQQPNGRRQSRVSPTSVSVSVSREQSMQSNGQASDSQTKTPNTPQSSGKPNDVERSESPSPSQGSVGCCWMGRFGCCKRRQVRPSFQLYRPRKKLCCKGDDEKCCGMHEQGLSANCEQKDTKAKVKHWYLDTGNGNIYCGPCTTAKLCAILKEDTTTFDQKIREINDEKLYLELKTLDHIIIKGGSKKSWKNLREKNFADTAKKLLKMAVERDENKDKDKESQKIKGWLAGIKLYTLRILATAIALEEVVGSNAEDQETEKKKIAAELAENDYLKLLVDICDTAKKQREVEVEKKMDKEPKWQGVRQLEAALVQLFYIAKTCPDLPWGTPKSPRNGKVPHTAREPKLDAVKKPKAPLTARVDGRTQVSVVNSLEEYRGIEEAKIQALAMLVQSRIAPEELKSVRPPDDAIVKLVSWVLITQDVQDDKDGTAFPYGIRFRAEDLLQALTILAEKELANSTQIWMAIEDYVDQLYSKKKDGEQPVAMELVKKLIKNPFVSDRMTDIAPEHSRIKMLLDDTASRDMEAPGKSNEGNKGASSGKQPSPGTGSQGIPPNQKGTTTGQDAAKPMPKCDIKMVESAIKFKKIEVVEKVVHVPEDLVAAAQDKAKAKDGKPASSEKQTILYQLMEKAIEQNNGSFVKHFIDKGVDLDGMTKQAEWGERTELVKDRLRQILPELSIDDRWHAMKRLLLWCLYKEKQEVALIFWKFETEKMTAALYAKTMLKARRMEAGNAYLSESIKMWEQEWEDKAFSILEQCQNDNLGKAVDLVQLKSEVWGGASCVDIAIKGKARKFLSAAAVTVYIDKLWVGHLHFDNFRDVWPRVLFVFALFFPPLLFALKYNKDEDFSASSHPGASGNDKPGKKPKEETPGKQESGQNNGQETPQKFKPEQNDDKEKTGNPGMTLVKFYSAPLVKCWINAILYIIFLAVFSYMILVEFSNPIQGAEIVVYIWMFTFIVQEIYEIWNLVSRATAVSEAQRSVALRLYFFNVWNILDIISHAGFVIGVAVRLVVVFCPTCTCRCVDAARVIFALDFIILCCRFLHIIAVDSYLGAKLVIISRMYTDLVGFVVILLVFVAAYAIASETVLYPNTPLTARLPFYLLRKAYFNIYGELFLEDLGGHGDCTDDFNLYSNYTITRCPTDYGVYVSQMMLGGYILFMNILLLNLLIAMFSYTFDRVMQKRNGYWHYERAKLVHEYLLRPILPPPFILFWFLYNFYRWIKNSGWCCCCTPESPAEQNDPDSLESIDEAVKNPPWLLEEKSGPPSLIQETNSTDLRNWGTKKANEVAGPGQAAPQKETEPDARLDELLAIVGEIQERLRNLPEAAPNKWQACFHVLSPYTGTTNFGGSHFRANHHNKKGAPPLNFDTRVYNPDQPVPRFGLKRRVISRKGRRASQQFKRQYTPLYSYKSQPSTESGSSAGKDGHNFFEDGPLVVQPGNSRVTPHEDYED